MSVADGNASPPREAALGGEGNRPLEFVLLSRLTTSLSEAKGRRGGGVGGRRREEKLEDSGRGRGGWERKGGKDGIDGGRRRMREEDGGR